MKRKTMALMLALSMCLSLLTACGSGGTATDEKPPESENAASSTEQPKESEKPEETEEPKEEEPEESAEPTQEEPKEKNNAGTAFLKLLQEEYKNGFVEGERPGCTYYAAPSEDFFAFISNGIVYIWDWDDTYNAKVFSYDIAAKKLSKNEIESIYEGGAILQPVFLINDTVYCADYATTIKAFDYNWVCQKTVAGYYREYFDKGVLSWNEPDKTMYLYSYDLEKIAEIPTTMQREAAHDLKEDVSIDFGNKFAADGTLYARTNEGYNSEWCRLNTDTYEWEKCESQPYSGFSLYDFCGKYGAREDGIYDRVTGEQIFAYGELYAPVCVADKGDSRNCYFGGDKYLGSNRSEIRWVNLTDLSMSAPLPFPEKYEDLYILNDTYCAYKDDYGWFLWNYNTGEEETIVMFEQ